MQGFFIRANRLRRHRRCRNASRNRFANRQHLAAVLLVEHFGHRQVNGAGAADDAFIAGEGEQCVVAGDVADGQQSEQQREAGEHELQHAVGAQGAEEHEQGEDAPQRQVDAEHVRLGGLSQAQTR